jgi:hypothetical protein
VGKCDLVSTVCWFLAPKNLRNTPIHQHLLCFYLFFSEEFASAYPLIVNTLKEFTYPPPYVGCRYYLLITPRQY